MSISRQCEHLATVGFEGNTWCQHCGAVFWRGAIGWETLTAATAVDVAALREIVSRNNYHDSLCGTECSDQHRAWQAMDSLLAAQGQDGGRP